MQFDPMFLHPGALWGLLALAVPILVHLLNFRPPRRVLFSQLSFVKAIHDVVVQQMRLKRLILLALRLLAIAAIVLVFAEPTWLSGRQGGMQPRSRRVLLLDNSASMRRADLGGSYLDQAKEAAKTLLQAMPATATVQLLTLNEANLLQSPVSPAEALEALQTIGYADQTQSLAACLQQLAGAQQTGPTEVWLISDLQRATLISDSQRAFPDSSTTLWLVPLGGEARPENLFPTHLKLEAPVLEPQQPIRLAFFLQNQTSQDLKAVSVKVMIEGSPVAATSGEIAAADSAALSVSFVPPGVGWLSGYLEVEDPTFSYDNRRYFSLHVPERSRLLVVRGQSPSRYLQVLLEKFSNRFELTTIEEKLLAGTQLGMYDGIVLEGITTLSRGVSERLSEWVQAGGGLVVFPSSAASLPDYNYLYSQLRIGNWGEARRLDPLMPMQLSDRQHPLFEGVFEEQGGGFTFDAPVVGQVMGFRPQPGNIQATPIRLSDGTPILHECSRGEGRVYTYTLLPELAWSDLPVKSIFVPMVYRTLLLAAGDVRLPLAYELSPHATVGIETQQTGLVKLLRTDGFEALPDQQDYAGGVLLRLHRTNLAPGNYQAIQAETPLQSVAFNLPAAESDFTTATPDDISEWLQQQGANIQVRVADTRTERLTGLVTEAELATGWRIWLLIALLCLLAEVVVVRLMK